MNAIEHFAASINHKTLFNFSICAYRGNCMQCENETFNILQPMYVAIVANSMNMSKPAITAHPHFCVSPNFRRVNRISESDDITESVFLSLRADGWRAHFFDTFIYRKINKMENPKVRFTTETF